MTLMSQLGVDIIEGQRSRSPLLSEETIKPSMPSKEITVQQSKRKNKRRQLRINQPFRTGLTIESAMLQPSNRPMRAGLMVKLPRKTSDTKPTMSHETNLR